jgi:hypothetical protein
MVATKEQWMASSTLPKGSSYDTMLEFFGIPPYTQDKLDDNIARKRRDWYAKTSCGNKRGREKAKEVVALIQRAAQSLKRGVVDDTGGGSAPEIPDTVFQTLEELWRIISEYVFADDYNQALYVAREAVSRWGMTADSASVLAWVVATGFDSGNLVLPALLQEGMQAADAAVRAQPVEARNWESKISLLLALSRAAEAAEVTDEAGRMLGGKPTARLYILRTRAMLGLNRAEDAMVAAVRAVHSAMADPDLITAVRSQATALLVDWMAANLLPINSASSLVRYVEMVDTAAWCSYGAPEAEDMVRVHRMWATNAGKRVFVGSWKLRSFLAVCTGFISLPIHNYLRSSPAWQVFLNGIQQQQRQDTSFAIVASPQYVQRAHRMNLVIQLEEA